MHRDRIKAPLAILGAALVATLFGCQQSVVPTGTLVPRPGDPYGEKSFPTFDINNMPSASYWNTRKDYEELPPLFQFANGSPVQTLDQWTGTEANGYKGRRWEIEQVLQHYQYGYMPDFGDKLTVTCVNNSATSATINLSYDGGSGVKTASFTLNARIPAGASADNPIPALIECGSGGTTSFSNALGSRYALIGLNVDNAASESNHAGVVQTLFGYDYANDLNAPSIFMAYAWCVGRIMDAMELSASPAFGGVIDSKKLMITGVSRYGKGAMVSGAFAKSKKGTQIAVTDIGSAGCCGPAIERFLSSIGLDAETARNAADVEGGKNIPGRVYYMKWTGSEDENPLVTASSQDVSWFASIHGDNSAPPFAGPAKTAADKPTVVKAVLKGEHDFEYHPWPYEGIFNGNYWHGLQTMAEVTGESPTWSNGRFKQFQDLHYGLKVDDVGGLPLRDPDGYLCTIPFDQHFLLALFAPRAVIIHDGYRTIRNNPEGCFLANLAADEVYKFYEDQDPADYANVSQFNAIKFYFITHSFPEYEMQDTVDLADVYFSERLGDADFDAPAAAAKAANYERLRDPPFPVTDPRSKHDYQKLNWARPGATPLSVQIAGVPEYDWKKTTEWD
jgi:hypothetical protein